MRTGNYLWQDPDASRSVQIALELVDRIALNALEGYKSLPHRGLEIGGILLGKIESAGENVRTWLSDFEVVDSEHRTGPSYRLSEADLERLQKTLERHPDAVGLYRTQTRSEDLALQDEDFVVFRRSCDFPGSVFLLIRPNAPGGAEAALYLWRDGALARAHEFPFRATELQAASVAAIPPPATAAEPLPVTSRILPREPAPAGARRGRAWVVPVAAVASGMVAGAAIYRFSQPSAPPAATRTSAAVAAPAAPLGHVALSVERDGPNLRVLWDRAAPAIRMANRALLYISDGTRQSTLQLDRAQIASGLLSYKPESQDVTFRLDVFAGGQSTEDSIRVVSPQQSPPLHGAASPAPVRRERPEHPSAVNTAERSEVAETRPSPFQPLPAPEVAKPPAAAPASVATVAKNAPAPLTTSPPATITRALDPAVSVTVEAPSGSRFGNILGHVPLLRRLKKKPQPFSPAAPLHEIRPTLTAKQRRELAHPVAVDVKVYVTESGKVDYAELLSNSGGPNRDLANAAVFAARRWDFEPAHLNGQAAPSEMLLHFRFTPAESAEAKRR